MTLHGERNFADVIKGKEFEMGDDSGLSMGGPV